MIMQFTFNNKFNMLKMAAFGACPPALCWLMWKRKRLCCFLCLSSSNHQLELWKATSLILERSSCLTTVLPCRSMPSVSCCRYCLEEWCWSALQMNNEVHGEFLKCESFCRHVFVLWRTSSELAASADVHISREWAEVWRSQTLNRSWARREGPGVGDRREPVG